MEKGFSVKELSAILKLLEQSEVYEFRLERGDEKISLKRGTPVANGEASSPPVQTVYAQMPGMYPQQPQYAAPSPSAPAESQKPEPASPPPVAPAGSSSASEPAAPVAPKSDYIEVKSPMVGTFYRRPAVDADPYVNVGDTVKKGDVLCIVEAMKLMNEIECEFSGKIVEVCLDDAQMVEYGEVLFRIAKS